MFIVYLTTFLSLLLGVLMLLAWLMQHRGKQAEAARAKQVGLRQFCVCGVAGSSFSLCHPKLKPTQISTSGLFPHPRMNAPVGRLCLQVGGIQQPARAAAPRRRLRRGGAAGGGVPAVPGPADPRPRGAAAVRDVRAQLREALHPADAGAGGLG